MKTINEYDFKGGVMKLSINAVMLSGILLFTGYASAADFSFGIKGGLNLAKPVGVNKDVALYDADNLTMKPGLIAGVAWELKLIEKFSVQPELLFSMKGAKTKADNTVSVLRLNYLDIPILLKLNIPIGIIVPNVCAGPSVGIRMGTGGYTENDSMKVRMTKDDIYWVMDHTNLIDFGVALGAGVGINAGPGSFVFDIRYTLGLMKSYKLTQDEKDLGISEDTIPTDKNGALSVTVGYMFDI